MGRVTTTISASAASPRSLDADVVVIGVTEGEAGPLPAPGAEHVDEALGGDLAGSLAVLGATGKAEEVTKIPSAGRLQAPLIAAVGLGPETGRTDPFRSGETLRRAAGAVIRALAQPGSPPAGPPGKRRIGLALPARNTTEITDVALGALLGGYVFSRYRTGGHGTETELIVLAQNEGVAEGVGRATVIADAVAMVRDLVNTPPADLTPRDLAAEAERVAAASGLTADVLGEKELAEQGYGGIVGVGQGSVNPPRLVRLEYQHPDAERTVVLAGKGITFDSGGLSLKPPASMETMKSDMGGAAAVLGAMQAIAALRPAVRVIGYLPIAENMPSGTAQRPSDVLTIYCGKTVEVLNTDAEGRLVLADVLARSASDEPDLLIDVATLTGAQLVALGNRVSAVMANDDATREAVVDAARRSGEAAWPMPLPDELRRSLDSAIADIANVGADKNAGMLVAGVFLREFVPAGVPWAHLDIAGPSFNDAEPYGYTPKGGTGAATRTLIQIAEDVAEGRL
ncbi:MAG: leucyl aminopeptidase [Micromonosporaceae bacterium]